MQATPQQACGCACPSPFERPEWYALLADSRQQAFFKRVETGGSHATIALNHTDGRIEALRNWYAFTWRPVVPAGEAGDAMLEALARDLKREAPRVTLWPLPDEDGSATRLAAAF
ncbi:MAG: GNAT family N-acetyltransferase, partial [Pseudomonadota bacterium]|nr:GNAT family N-acetyltransferase [Pseudomonadota bacterium]